MTKYKSLSAYSKMLEALEKYPQTGEDYERRYDEVTDNLWSNRMVYETARDVYKLRSFSDAVYILGGLVEMPDYLFDNMQENFSADELDILDKIKSYSCALEELVELYAGLITK